MRKSILNYAITALMSIAPVQSQNLVDYFQKNTPNSFAVHRCGIPRWRPESVSYHLTKAGYIERSPTGSDELYEADTWLDRWRKEHAKIFGTVENPTYGAEENRFVSTLDTRLETIYPEAEAVENIKGSNKALIEFLEIISKDRLDKNGTNIDDLIILKKIIDITHECYRTALINGATIRSQDHYPDAEYRDVTPVETSKMLFALITSYRLPDIVQIERKDLAGAPAHHSPTENKVVVEGKHHPQELITLLHEFGHVAAQHGEQSTGVIYEPTRIKEIAALEEACAFAFAHIGISALHGIQPGFAKVLLTIHDRQMTYLAKKHYEGSLEEHDWGAAYFLAAREAFEDPTTIFNTLAKVKNSDPRNLPELVTDNLRLPPLIQKPGELVEEYATFERKTDLILQFIEKYQKRK